MQKENFYIEKCKTLIEEKLAWGSSATWQNQDFENLSEKIFQATETQLSITTLKRLWGKVQYNSTPNAATLNALAQFVGYENWRAFTANGFQLPIEKDAIISESIQKPELETPSVFLQKKSHSKTIWGILGVVLIASAVAFWAFNKKAKTLIFNNLAFSSAPVTEGIPNSVVFKYDASDSNADSVFIQQSWDERLRFKVDKFQKEYVSTYYRPGYFRAKLVLNDSIVKEHDLFIESQGWLGMIERDQIPIYFSKKTIEKQGKMGIYEADVTQQGIDFSTATPWVCLTQVDKNKTVPSDNFVMEIELKNTYNKGDGICQQTRIVLLATEGVIMIPLSIKGCIGELELHIASEFFDGKTKDLSLFGVDFGDWVSVRYAVKNNYAKIFVNNQLAYEGIQNPLMGTVVGTRIGFKGAGEVRRFELRKL